MHTLAQLRNGSLAGVSRLDLRENLRCFPQEVFDLADSLEVLNLTGNALHSLPDDLPRLHRLRILFCSENAFTSLPEVLSACPSLEMVGFKSNRISHLPDQALPPHLRWLILTDNCLSTLPDTLGSCSRLQKLMLSGNQLTRLPDSLVACSALELVRVAANRLQTLPSWLPQLPRLAWLAFAGNPCSPTPPEPQASAIASIAWPSLAIGEKLGDGASGEIFSALPPDAPDRPVAVKLFKGALTSDGFPENERLACLHAGRHAHLIPLLGQITHHPDARPGLVMERIDPGFAALGGPPSFDTCTRDVYSPSLQLTGTTTVSLVRGVASAVRHLHAKGLLHGDLYAHNVLFHPDGRCYLGDLGAASLLPSPHSSPLVQQLKRLDLRALGILISELLQRTTWQPGDSANHSRLTRIASDLMNPNGSLPDLLSDL